MKKMEQPGLSESESWDTVLVRYGEIALKRGNRVRFEKKLIENLKGQLLHHGVGYDSITRITGRILIKTHDGRAAHVASKTFGVTSVSPAKEIESDLEAICFAASQMMSAIDDVKTFRVSSRRLEKSFPKTSQEVNEEVGARIVKDLGLKVKLTDSQVDLVVEITKDATYIAIEKIQGFGGLPTGIHGKVMVLFSGGIDSPVAAWQIMRRGCDVDLIHFLHEKKGGATPKKFENLVKTLRGYKKNVRLFCIPTPDIERQIIMNVPSKDRIVVLRRVFYHLGDIIAKKHGYKAIVNGDNLGQVASQTLENLKSQQMGCETLIIRPLVCYDKSEIIDLSRKIGLYSDSLADFTDCCSFLVAKHPETASDPKEIEEQFLRLDERILAQAVEDSFEVRFDE